MLEEMLGDMRLEYHADPFLYILLRRAFSTLSATILKIDVSLGRRDAPPALYIKGRTSFLTYIILIYSIIL